MIKIGPLTNSIVEEFIKTMKDPITQDKIKVNVVDPITQYVLDKVYPYFVITSIIFILTFLIALLILFLMLKKNL